jgi:hypothetical protein
VILVKEEKGNCYRYVATLQDFRHPWDGYELANSTGKTPANRHQNCYQKGTADGKVGHVSKDNLGDESEAKATCFLFPLVDNDAEEIECVVARLG